MVQGSGSIVFGNSVSNQLTLDGGQTTFGPNITIHGQNGTISAANSGTFVNQGFLEDDVNGGVLTVNVPGWTNQGQGVIEALNGGTIDLVSAWVNASTASTNMVAGDGGSSIVLGGAVTAPAGSTAMLNAVASSTATTIDLSQADVPVNFTINPANVSANTTLDLIGGKDVNTFTNYTTISGQDTPVDAPVQMVGGPVGSTNTFNLIPANTLTLVDKGGDNTLDLSNAVIPVVNGVDDTGSATVTSKGVVRYIGVTVIMTDTAGEPQFVYQGQLADPDIGSLVDPSLLTSSNLASVSLQGVFENVILGSGATLFAAPSSFSPTTGAGTAGTHVTLVGVDNTVYGAADATITGNQGNNTVIQNFDETQANAYLAAAAQSTYNSSSFFTSTAQQQALLGNTAVQQALVLNPAAAQSLVGNASALQAILSNSSAVQRS